MVVATRAQRLLRESEKLVPEVGQLEPERGRGGDGVDRRQRVRVEPIAVTALVALVVYLDFLLLRAVLSSLALSAVLFAAVSPYRFFVASIIARLQPYRRRISCTVLCVGLAASRLTDDTLLRVMAVAVSLAGAALVFSKTHVLTAIALTHGVGLVIAVISLGIVGPSYLELTRAYQSIAEPNASTTFNDWTVWQKLAESSVTDLSSTLKERMASPDSIFAPHVPLVTSNKIIEAEDILLHLVRTLQKSVDIFHGHGLDLSVTLTTLFHALQNAEKLIDYLEQISPFGSVQDTRWLGFQFSRAAQSIIIADGVIFSSHATATWLVLSLARHPLATTLAVADGALATLPIGQSISTWVVAAAILGSKGTVWHTICLAVLKVVIFLGIHPWVYSKVPTAHFYCTALSVTFGISAFGLQGAVFGPTLLCLTVSMLGLYNKHRAHDKHY